MKLTIAFLRFLLSRPGKGRTASWLRLRRLCMDRVGVKWGSKKKEQATAP